MGHLYQNICNFDHIMTIYDEVRRNTRNKRRIMQFEAFKCCHITRIYNTVVNKTYKPGPYNVFMIREPKERLIMSQKMYDKIINHLVCRYILMPALTPCLIDANVASREGMGTKEGLRLYYKYRYICDKKYGTYYLLKCDISQYFYSIDHEILKQKIRRKIKDPDALKITDDIIDSVKSGLPIGNMTSQLLAIFYLNDLDHYIKEVLHIKYYVRYQDDFILMHESKDYLKYCLEQIRIFVEKEKLHLNKKTRLFKNTNNITYLGRKVNGGYANYRRSTKKLKKNYKLYDKEIISLNSLLGSIMSYENIIKRYHF